MRKYRAEMIFLAPLLIYLLAFTLWPIFQATLMAFTSYASGHFPSLASFASIVSHFQFHEAVFNTLIITFVGLALEFVLGLGLALLLLEKFPGHGFFRALMLLPLGVPTIVVAANMRYLFDTNGFLNEVLFRLGLAAAPINWLGGGAHTLFTLIVADMWKVTPLVMLIMLAGLQSISKEVLEAAEIDGASYLQRLRLVLLPLLKPFITMALIVRGIDAFRIFELPLALTGRTVPVMASYSFFEYREFDNPYTAAASAALLMVMILLAITVYFRLVNQQETVG